MPMTQDMLASTTELPAVTGLASLSNNTTQNKISMLQDKVQEKVSTLTGKFEPATLESMSDADSPTMVGVVGGKGKGGDLTGKFTEDRAIGFDAYEVAHPNDPYQKTDSGIAKYERQRQRLANQIQEDPSLIQKLGIKDPRNITNDDIARAGTREQLLGLYNLIPGKKAAWEPGPLDYFDSNHALELGSKDNPLNIPVERATTGGYDYFGRPMSVVRNKDTAVSVPEALGYKGDGSEDAKYDVNKSISALKARGELTPELEAYLNKSAKYTNSNAQSTPKYTAEDLRRARELTSTNRSWGDAASDTGKQVVVGSLNAVKNLADIYGVATGDHDNWVSQTMGDAAKWYGESYSPALKAAAEHKGSEVAKGKDELEKFWIATKENFKNPMLISQLVVESAPMMAVALAGGEAMAAAKLGIGATEGMLAAGAVQQGADMGDGVYQSFFDPMKVTQKDWDNNETYRAYVKQGMSPLDAKEKIASDTSRVVALASGLLSYGVNKYMPGGHSIESRLTGGKVGGLVKSTAGESATEIVEEGGGQIFQNIGQQQIKPGLDTFANVGQVSADAMAAGGATNVAIQGPGALTTPDSTKKEELAKKLEELQTNTEAEAKANMSNTLDMETPVEVTEADTKLSEDLGVQSIKEMHNEAKSVDELKSKMEEAKMQILDNIYEYELDENGNSRITGVKDPSKLKAAEDWLDEYARYQADVKGNVPKGVQEEVEYIKNAGIEAGLQTVETKATSAEEKLAKAVKKEFGETGNVEDIEKQVAATIAEYKLDKVEGLQDRVIQQVKNMYGISGMSVAGEAKIELDRDALNEMVAQNAGIRTHLGQRATPTDGKVIEAGSVTNEALADAVFGLGTEYDSAHPNTKFRERVLRHLDPTTSSTVVDTLRGIGSALASVVDKNVESAGKVLKGGDVKGNMLRLSMLALSTIDAQVASDTELRENTIKDSSMLKAGEYYASLNNVIEQIGKNYATSYGLKVTGKAEDVAKVYRDLGRLGVDLAQQAGLIEITNDYIWNRVGDVVDAKGNKLISAAVKEGVETSKGKDALTDKEVLLTKDRGVRLIDTVAKHDELAEEGNRNDYKSELGNAAKRVSKILLPNSERVPSTEYVKKPRKKDPHITIDEQTEKDIEHREKTPLIMKRGKIYDVLKYLKGENESVDGGLNNVKNPRIRTFLGLKDTKSKLLAVGERGANMSKLDNIIGILDNLDTLANEKGVYYTFQVDINNRLTVEQSVANYQSDKVYARPIMGTGEYSVTDLKDKEILINSIVDELASKDQKEGMKPLDVLAYYADKYNKIEEVSKGDMKAFVEILAGTMESGLAFGHLKKLGGIRVLSALEAARDVVNSNGGTIITEYIPEKDASASGVFNTLLNIAGRNPNIFKAMLTKLGVKFEGGEFTKDRTDAYSMLGQKIDQMISDMTDMEGIATTLAAQHVKAVARIKETLDDDKLLRDLAKYPIMTWFYSAEKDSIVDNLTKEMTDVLVEKAILGDEKVLKYISDIAGKEMSVKDVQNINKGDKVHRALREELNKIGEAYYMQLTEVFPEVEANKKEMQDHFDLLQKNSIVGGKDYWDGKVRTALGALHGTDATMSLYKWKNQAMNLSAQEKIDMGLATDDESTMLFTKQNRLANVTSMLALMMHSIDAAQAITGQAAVGGNHGMQLIHDGFRSIPRNLRRFQEIAEKVTVEIAETYDIMSEMAWAMRQTAKRMEEDLKDAKPEVKKDLEFAIKKLNERADAIDAKNKAHLDAKKAMLKNAETSLFGMDGKGEVVEEVATVPEVTVEEKAKEVAKTVLDVIESLSTVDGRKADILSGKYNDVLVTLDDKVKAELLKTASKDTKAALEEKFKQGGSFAYKGKVYVGSLLMAGRDEVMNRKARDTEILSTLMHEIEHTVIDEYVSKEANGAIKVEFEKIASLLNKAKGKNLQGSVRTRTRVANIMHFVEQGNMEQAVKELVATSREDEVAVQVFEALNQMAEIKGNLLERLVSAVWNKVKSMLDNTSVEELLAKTDVYSLAIAVKSIQDKARGLDKGIAKVEDGKINTDKTPFDEDFSEYTKDLDNIC